MHCFVTGAAGFIGSNFVDRLLADGHHVVGFDNFSTGRAEFLEDANRMASFSLIEGDTLDPVGLTTAMRGADVVLHLAANADVRFGTQHPDKDLQQNTIATHNVLEAMRVTGAGRIIFASTGSVYGETKVIPTPEDAPFPVQTSLYGASKMAAEGLIQAYCEGYKLQCFIFRFVSILGERYTHGHVVDFYRQLRAHPSELQILGNGRQRKSYLYVNDCVSAVLTAFEKATEDVNIFNLGTDEYCEVNDSINWICDYLGKAPVRMYSGGDRGWIGDNPFIYLDCARIRALGWRPALTIRQGVERTVDYLVRESWSLDGPT